MSLQPAHHVVTPQHHMVVKQCLEELGEWRAFIIGVDGWTGSGKSTLARVLAWQLEMPCIETDLFLTGNGWGHYDWDTLGRLVAKRLDHSSSGRSAGRPVIVEGVGLLHILKNFSAGKPTFLFRFRTRAEPSATVRTMRDGWKSTRPTINPGRGPASFFAGLTPSGDRRFV